MKIGTDEKGAVDLLTVPLVILKLEWTDFKNIQSNTGGDT